MPMIPCKVQILTRSSELCCGGCSQKMNRNSVSQPAGRGTLTERSSMEEHGRKRSGMDAGSSPAVPIASEIVATGT